MLTITNDEAHDTSIWRCYDADSRLLYWSGDGWTTDSDQAHRFASYDDAVTFALLSADELPLCARSFVSRIVE